MTGRRRNLWLAVAAGMLAVLVLAVAGPDLLRREPPPASQQSLRAIADRNEKAAVDAAAHQRAESEASAEAADQAIARAEALGRDRAEAAIRAANANEAERQSEPSE